MDYTKSSASISLCGTYRYRLTREWCELGISETWNWDRDEPFAVLFIMLNPSTADGDADDPTIRRCVSFARQWGYERMEVVNLFAARATQPKDLFGMQFPVGDYNEDHVASAIQSAGLVVCAWGNHGAYLAQDRVMLGWLAKHRHTARHEPHVLRFNANKMPAHPLYLRGDAKPVRWRPNGWVDL